MRYLGLSDKEYSIDLYRIVPIREEDMSAIKLWRNEQMDVLRQSRPLTDEDQFNYYVNAIKPTFQQTHPRMMLFSYLLDDRLVGYGGLTNVDWVNRRAEISYLLETVRSSEEQTVQYKNDFSHFLRLMKQVAFKELSLHRLFTETFDIRPLHILILESSGFQYEGRMRHHVRIMDKYVDSLLHGCLNEEYDHV